MNSSVVSRTVSRAPAGGDTETRTPGARRSTWARWTRASLGVVSRRSISVTP